MNQYQYWTDAEMKILYSIRHSKKSVKSQLHRLPGRTLCGVSHQLKKLARKTGTKKKRQGFSWIWVAAINLLKETPGITAIEISEQIGCSYRQAGKLVYENHRSEKKCIYISGWEKHGVNQIPQWTIGNDPDAPRLPLQTHEEDLRKARARHQKRRIKQGAFNPFATAAGLIQAPTGQTGRVFKQDMSIDQWAQSRSAA